MSDIEQACRKCANKINSGKFSGLTEDLLTALVREQVGTIQSLLVASQELHESARARIAALEAALAEMIGSHGEPCREQNATGEDCESVKRARATLKVRP